MLNPTPVTSLAKSGGTKLRGGVTLSEGSNVTITQSGNDLAIAASSDFATQAEMEAATSTTDVVSPGRVHFHPGVAKAWIAFDGTTVGTTTLSDYNCDACADDGTGNYRVVFTTDFADTNYCVLGFAKRPNDTAGAQSVVTMRGTDTRSGAEQEIRVVSGSADIDAALVCVAAFGDHA